MSDEVRGAYADVRGAGDGIRVVDACENEGRFCYELILHAWVQSQFSCATIDISLSAEKARELGEGLISAAAEIDKRLGGSSTNDVGQKSQFEGQEALDLRGRDDQS